MNGKESTENYLPALLEGRADDLLGLFAAYPVIDDPIAGRVAGRERVGRFVEGRREWLVARRKKSTRAEFLAGETLAPMTESLEKGGYQETRKEEIVDSEGSGEAASKARGSQKPKRTERRSQSRRSQK